MIDQAPGGLAKRPLTTGHTGNQSPNYFGYDEFLRLCQELKMEPIVVVNFRDGLLAADGPGRAARHAAQLAAYCNARVDAELPQDLAPGRACVRPTGHPRPYGVVKYFQIGNETWAYSNKPARSSTCSRGAFLDAIRRIDSTVGVIVDGQPPELARRVQGRLGDRISCFAVHHSQPWQIREIRRGDTPVDAADLSEADIWYAWVTLPQVGADGQSCCSGQTQPGP